VKVTGKGNFGTGKTPSSNRLENIFKQSGNNQKVKIILIDGTFSQIEVHKNSTVQDLKIVIQKELGIPYENQTLISTIEGDNSGLVDTEIIGVRSELTLIIESENLNLINATNTQKNQDIQSALENKADINTQTKEGFTGLMLSVLHGNQQMVLLYIEKEADLNLQSFSGETALIYAAKGTGDNDLDIVGYLLTAGADKTIKDNNNKTALDVANQERSNGKGDQRIIDLLNSQTSAPEPDL
jgi:uncharacterized protein